MVDLTDIASRIYSRARTDAAGASLRTQLGAGASSVITVAELDAANLPARPFIALADGGLAFDAVGTAQTLTPVWWIYDDLNQKRFRFRVLIPLLVALYTGDGAPVIQVTTGGAIGHLRVANVGLPRSDPAFRTLDTCPLQLQLYLI